MSQAYKNALHQGWEDYFNIIATGTDEEIKRQSKLNQLLCSKAIKHDKNIHESVGNIRRKNSHTIDAA